MPGPDAGTAQRLGGPWPRTHTQGEEALVRAHTPAPAARRPAGCLPPRPAPRTQAPRADPRLARSGGVAPERVGGADRGRAGLSAAPRAQPERPTGKLRARAGVGRGRESAGDLGGSFPPRGVKAVKSPPGFLDPVGGAG